MKINGMGNCPTVHPQAIKKSTPPKEVQLDEGSTVQEAEQNESQEKVRGVIRLLQEGHFKGVADVRLRINFFDEIQALESRTLKTAAMGNFDGFNQNLQEQIAALQESVDLTEEQVGLIDAFLESLKGIQSGFVSSGEMSIESLIEQMQGEFENLMELLNPPAAAPEQQQEPDPGEAVLQEGQIEIPVIEENPNQLPGEPISEETQTEPVEPAMIEPVQAETNPFETFLQGLRESFESVLQGLQSGLTNTSALPPISEPSGNGKAFAKFLEIYEAMQSGVETKVPEPESMDFEEVVIPEETEVPEEVT